MNYTNFIQRVTRVTTPRKTTIYPPELLKAVEVLHFDKHRDLKLIAHELRKEEEWKDHTHAALHSAFSRHCRKVAKDRNLPRRAPFTKTKRQPV